MLCVIACSLLWTDKKVLITLESKPESVSLNNCQHQLIEPFRLCWSQAKALIVNVYNLIQFIIITSFFILSIGFGCANNINYDTNWSTTNMLFKIILGIYTYRLMILILLMTYDA